MAPLPLVPLKLHQLQQLSVVHRAKWRLSATLLKLQVQRKPGIQLAQHPLPMRCDVSLLLLALLRRCVCLQRCLAHCLQQRASRRALPRQYLKRLLLLRQQLPAADFLRIAAAQAMQICCSGLQLYSVRSRVADPSQHCARASAASGFSRAQWPYPACCTRR